MASFLHASFHLTVDSVALALQSSIGGDAAFFRVIQLSDKRFRFSLANNHVGHFIYSLRERTWPAFQIAFSLYRRDPNASVLKDPSLFSGFNSASLEKVDPVTKDVTKNGPPIHIRRSI